VLRAIIGLAEKASLVEIGLHRKYIWDATAKFHAAKSKQIIALENELCHMLCIIG
jgi:hypothetical protein